MFHSPPLHPNSSLNLNSTFSPLSFLPRLTFFYKPSTLHILSAHHHLRANPQQCLAQLPEPSRNAIITAVVSDAATQLEDGPIELSSEAPSIFATTDDPSPLQVTTSVLLTGVITVFLFRSIRRRVKRAKELRLRSSGATKALKDEALDSLKALGAMSVEPGSPPSPAQALLGGLAAGVIALILYKFTATVEAALSRQTISDNYSVRQITITIRTIINGMCYLATFVFGINSIGLFLYSGQLAINALFEGSASKDTGSNEEKQKSSSSSSESQTNAGPNIGQSDDNSDVSKQ